MCDPAGLELFDASGLGDCSVENPIRSRGKEDGQFFYGRGRRIKSGVE